MNKSIKVSDQVYGDLLNLQQPRETYSDVVARLIKLYYVLLGAAPMIGGAAEYWRLKSDTKQEIAAALRPGDISEVPHV